MMLRRRAVAGGFALALLGVAMTAVTARTDLFGVGAPDRWWPGSVVAASPAAPPSVVVSSTRLGAVVHPDSIGLSVETAHLGDPGMQLSGGIAPLLRALGPSVLRVGGNSADKGAAVVTSPATLGGLLAVLRASGWSVLLSEDLGHYSAAVAQADARVSLAVLGSRLAGIACGNESEGFVSAGYRRPGWGLPQLLLEDTACLRAVHQVVPHVLLVGPDSSRGVLVRQWAAAMAGTDSMATTHFYPMARCRVPWRLAPTLLGPQAQQLEVGQLAPAVAAAHAHGLALRVDETNSAACGGVPGLSNAYASALWGADDVFTVIGLGAEGLNLHGVVTAAGCLAYSPICLPAGRRTVQAQPLYDGLLLAHDVGLGPLLEVSSSDPVVRAHAVARTDGSTGVLLENESGAPVTLRLVVPAGAGPASTTTMSDPGGLTALSGVSLRRGEVQPVGATGAVATFSVTLAPWSAQALVAPAPSGPATAGGAGRHASPGRTA